MSRVEDDRDAARVAARLAEAKRTEEGQRTKKATENNAFSKLVQTQKKEGEKAQETNFARSAIAQMLEAAEAGQAELSHGAEKAQEGQHAESTFKSKLGAKGQDAQLKSSARTESRQGDTLKAAEDQGQAQTAQGRTTDQASSSKGAESRKLDSKVSTEKLEERKEASESSSSSRAGPTSGKGDKGELKADADKGGGGQQQGGGGGKDGNAAAANPGFRFNPALMAPVPVAKQKEASGSERLRKVAAEVAQKIVERVRVGTNAAGKVEFQIDLRSDVLSGLSVKISAHNGKIKAVFQGSDKDVLKLIEEQRESLTAALGARGLTLEDLKIEARG